jgi:hypothetical protein
LEKQRIESIFRQAGAIDQQLLDVCISLLFDMECGLLKSTSQQESKSKTHFSHFLCSRVPSTTN